MPIILFFLLCSFISFNPIEASTPSPTPFVNGINVITGQVDVPLNKYEYEYGTNSKVKKIIEKNSSSSQEIEFYYFPHSTEVVENQQTKNVYNFDPNQLIISLEHYTGSTSNWTLYRKEKLFWKTLNSIPYLYSRVLEDEQGIPQVCYLCDYNSKGQLTKETIYGNLSGSCTVPLSIQIDGLPLPNGIESYNVQYIYSAQDSDLLEKIVEEKGLETCYYYDSTTKQCIAKLQGNASEILSRCFYEYDHQGCLSKTIVDDGQGKTKEDLTGVTYRKIMVMESSHALTSYGQPTKIENKFYDLLTKQEVSLDQITYTYSNTGELLQQDCYDAQGVLVNSTKNKEIAALETSSFTETIHHYDHFGRLIETIFPSVLDKDDQVYSLKLQQKYNCLDQIVQNSDSFGNTISTSYNIRGKPTHIYYPDGSTEIFEYFLDGELKSKKERNGHQTQIERDALSRVAAQYQFAADGSLIQSAFYTYQGQLIKSITDRKHYTIYFEYDGAGRQTGYWHETKEGTRHISCTYTPNGKPERPVVWLPSGPEDFNLNYPQEVETDKQPVNTVFTQDKIIVNQRGQCVKLQETVDEKGIKQLTTFDALDRPENKITLNPFGVKIAEVDIRHDHNGNKTLERHYRIYQGQSIGLYLIQWEYDSNGRLIGLHEGLNSSHQKTTYYHYNNSGQLVKLTQPNGNSLHYTYDSRGLLIELQTDDHSVHYRHQYDEQQRLSKIEDLVHSTCQYFDYDAFGQLIEEKNPHFSLYYTYDLAGRRTSFTLPDQSSIQYCYNGLQLTTIKRLNKEQNLVYTHQYIYEANYRYLKSAEMINNIGTLDYHYNDKGQLLSLVSPWWSESITTNDLDPQNRLLTTEIKDPKGIIKHGFEYNEVGQLTAENTSLKRNYTYDSLYNRLQLDQQEWKVNELNQLIQTPQFHYSYNPNGHLIQKSNLQETHTYTYDALNRLTRWEKTHSIAKEYQYDAFNRKTQEQLYSWNEQKAIWQLDKTHYFIYDKSNEIGKIDEQGQIVELRVLGQGRGAEIGAAVALELNGRLFAPIHDLRGSVRCLIDAQDATVAEFYRYTSFGEEEIYNNQGEKQNHSLVGNPWRYCSKRCDESQLVFFGLRHYDPAIGRWTTPDPLLFCDTPNLYAFVKNDPINHYDLEGLFSISSLWNTTKQSFFACFNYLKATHSQIRQFVKSQLQFPSSTVSSITNVGKVLLGDCARLLLGYYRSESHVGVYGERELDKVRITFINGILSTDQMRYDNLDLISKSHGGVKVHYIFRGTDGWTWDISRAILIKLCYTFGYRSIFAHLLAQTWKELIEEMGGVDGGGVIIHYAHSLGGCDTDRARSLLSPEEQKMIRVFTFGTATLIRDEGFQSVVNIISINDGVSSLFIDPLGHFCNLLNPQAHVRIYGKLTFFPFTRMFPGWPIDHLLKGFIYRPILIQLGKNFVEEFDK